MLETILELGIVPFFENVIPGYSIEEMTPRSNWFDGQEDLCLTPWDFPTPGAPQSMTDGRTLGERPFSSQ